MEDLRSKLEGTLHLDDLSRALYATDASVYRKLPLGAAYPRTTADIQELVRFAGANDLALIPRTAGTSLAGQCVGEGLVVDVSRHFTKVLKLDVEKQQVVVQPGVIRDELNQFLAPHGLFFGPNTSTSNRCMIGGMVGNNSSGTTSIRYGVTRDKVISLKTILSDGSEAVFERISDAAFMKKAAEGTFEGSIYKNIYKELSDKKIQKNILQEFPKPQIHRRNTGYAVDELLKCTLFGGDEDGINLCALLCGSEGTLAFSTEITLQLDPLPPAHKAMVVTHYKTLQDCLADVAPLMEHELHLCEMMDKVILDCTRNNRAQLANRFFVAGDPAALLMLELNADTAESLEKALSALLESIASSGLSYAHPVLRGADISRAIELRKAGLGLLGNMVGDRKAVACIEDTAVALEDLKDFIAQFSKIMEKYGQQAVYYAHAGAGELHLRPILNLKKSGDVALFRSITTEVARLTKQFGGSFSGEHGDGIVRAEFIPLMIGEENYALLQRVKKTFDPNTILNPGKIVNAYPMDASLRYEVDRSEPEITTFMNFSDSQGILRAAEKCNGSGDCRKTHQVAGAMCPSYHATKNEKDTTRARANALREFLSTNDAENRFNREELKEVFDLCLSCKACSSECPSNVDVATLKSEFLYQYQEANGYPMRSRLFAYNTRINRVGSRIPRLMNAVYGSSLLGSLIKDFSGVARKRSFPQLAKFDFTTYLAGKPANIRPGTKKVLLYIDEFTQYMDTQLGADAIDLLIALGYEVRLFFGESGRTFLSKGFLRQARALAEKNIDGLLPFIKDGWAVAGLEPSAILSFRDEYQRFGLDADAVNAVAASCFLIEEFLSSEIKAGSIGADSFTKESKEVKIHNHCHQKALSNQKITFDLLNLPENYKISIINSGCCGMAGSFGYEKEHYEVSMQIGELRLFPSIRKSVPEVMIAANGTSCRHQIFDGTGRKALHPVSILKEALLSD